MAHAQSVHALADTLYPIISQMAAGGSPRGSTRAIMTLLNEPHGIKPHRPLRDRDEQNANWVPFKDSS
jgi:hypothetical protein